MEFNFLEAASMAFFALMVLSSLLVVIERSLSIVERVKHLLGND